eukprot:CAMPEP_0175305690 /NCGR_PEP_ID=MMETSP0093-20121207/63873_1 /TAXON_ID=311494 /ORGANISM="Alexandrium monilatum, Strain CCMP3105" /LENGTH=232 /DNA_ID=CAMNT_0016602123 /DNA_START=303 /DNA_END=1000 /DNA_ORIENTATION=+
MSFFWTSTGTMFTSTWEAVTDDLYQDPRPVQDLLGQQQHEVSALADVLLQLAEVGQVLRVEENGRLHVVAWVELVLQDHPLEGLLQSAASVPASALWWEMNMKCCVGSAESGRMLLFNTAMDEQLLFTTSRRSSELRLTSNTSFSTADLKAEDVRALPVVVEAPDEDPGVPHGVAVGRGVPCENRGEGADIHGKHRSVAERLELAAVLPSGPEGGLRDEVPVVQHNIGNAAV